MNPKISVVIPVYNSEDFIAKTIESVFSQSYPAHEIIVIDDGSTDDTPKILERFKDKIISKRIENTGSPSTPRNIAMGMATGDYIAFLDADDLWFKNKLKRQVEFILKYPNAGFFCCDFAVRRPDRRLRLKKHFSLLRCRKQMNFDEPLKIDPFKLLIEENFVGGPLTVVIKKEIIDKVGKFADCLIYTVDYDYWLRCARITGFVVISDLLAYKKTHSTNFSSDRIRFYIRHGNTLKKTMQEMSSYITEKGLLYECRMALAENCYNLGNSYFEAGKIKNTFSAYGRGMLCAGTLKNMVLFASAVSKKIIRIISFHNT